MCKKGLLAEQANALRRVTIKLIHQWVAWIGKVPCKVRLNRNDCAQHSHLWGKEEFPGTEGFNQIVRGQPRGNSTNPQIQTRNIYSRVLCVHNLKIGPPKVLRIFIDQPLIIIHQRKPILRITRKHLLMASVIIPQEVDWVEMPMKAGAT
jgi:hypothetical protein